MSTNNASKWDTHFLQTRYRFVRVSRSTGEETEVIKVLKGGTISRNDDTSIKESAEITLIDDYDFGPDFVRVYIRAMLPSGEWISDVLGTFLPVTPSATVNGAYRQRTLKMYGRLQELVDDSFATGYTVPAGTNAVEAATKICTDAGFTVIADDSSYTISTARQYGIKSEQEDSETNDTKLGAVNDLLSKAGFRAAFTDTIGRIHLQKYSDPADIEPSWNFVEGKDAHFESAMTEERDYTDTANHVVVRYSDTSTGETVIGEAWDKDPMSELSTVSRGRTITNTYDYNELPDGKTTEAQTEYANKRAATLLKTAQAVIYKVNITAAYTPTTINQTATLEYPTAGISGKFQMRTQTLTLAGGCPTAIELRQFNRRNSRSA